ncbi:hypothetical protein BU15DRAFT_63912 [Melanogaster broomeanus]|nr:hypothetical protein BU15DRAFT_63912 [Melanogaster broomeanus]
MATSSCTVTLPAAQHPSPPPLLLAPNASKSVYIHFRTSISHCRRRVTRVTIHNATVMRVMQGSALHSGRRAEDATKEEEAEEACQVVMLEGEWREWQGGRWCCIEQWDKQMLMLAMRTPDVLILDISTSALDLILFPVRSSWIAACLLNDIYADQSVYSSIFNPPSDALPFSTVEMLDTEFANNERVPNGLPVLPQEEDHESADNSARGKTQEADKEDPQSMSLEGERGRESSDNAGAIPRPGAGDEEHQPAKPTKLPDATCQIASEAATDPTNPNTKGAGPAELVGKSCGPNDEPQGNAKGEKGSSVEGRVRVLIKGEMKPANSLRNLLKHPAANSLIDGWKSMELCQVYILMSIYAVPARRWEEDRSWLYTGLAVSCNRSEPPPGVVAIELPLDELLSNVDATENNHVALRHCQNDYKVLPPPLTIHQGGSPSDRCVACPRTLDYADVAPLALCEVYSSCDVPGTSPGAQAASRKLYSMSKVLHDSIDEYDRVHMEYMSEYFLQQMGLFKPKEPMDSPLATSLMWPSDITSVALGFFQIALFDLLGSLGLKPDAVVGHSERFYTPLALSLLVLGTDSGLRLHLGDIAASTLQSTLHLLTSVRPSFAEIFAQYPGLHVPTTTTMSMVTANFKVHSYTPDYLWNNLRQPVFFSSAIPNIIEIFGESTYIKSMGAPDAPPASGCPPSLRYGRLNLTVKTHNAPTTCSSGPGATATSHKRRRAKSMRDNHGETRTQAAPRQEMVDVMMWLAPGQLRSDIMRKVRDMTPGPDSESSETVGYLSIVHTRTAMVGEMVPILQAKVSSPDAHTVKESVSCRQISCWENTTDSQREGYQSEIVNMVWSWLVDETPRSGRRQLKPLTRFRSALGPKPLTKLYLRCWKSCVSLVKALVSFDGMSMSFDEHHPQNSRARLTSATPGLQDKSRRSERWSSRYGVVSVVYAHARDDSPLSSSSLAMPPTDLTWFIFKQVSVLVGQLGWRAGCTYVLASSMSSLGHAREGQRLENLSWQLWHLGNLIVDNNAKSKREFKKLSQIMGDKLDKEKGRFSLDHPSPVSANVAVSKLDLKPSAAFKETITRCGRPTTCANIAGNEANGCHTLVKKYKEDYVDVAPLALCEHLGNRMRQLTWRTFASIQASTFPESVQARRANGFAVGDQPHVALRYHSDCSWFLSNCTVWPPGITWFKTRCSGWALRQPFYLPRALSLLAALAMVDNTGGGMAVFSACDADDVHNHAETAIVSAGPNDMGVSGTETYIDAFVSFISEWVGDVAGIICASTLRSTLHLSTSVRSSFAEIFAEYTGLHVPTTTTINSQLQKRFGESTVFVEISLIPFFGKCLLGHIKSMDPCQWAPTVPAPPKHSSSTPIETYQYTEYSTDLAVNGRNWKTYCKNLLRVAAEANLVQQYDSTDMLPADALSDEVKAWQRRIGFSRGIDNPWGSGVGVGVRIFLPLEMILTRYKEKLNNALLFSLVFGMGTVTSKVTLGVGRRNAIAKQYIAATIPDALFMCVMHLKTARELFQCLANLFETKKSDVTQWEATFLWPRTGNNSAPGGVTAECSNCNATHALLWRRGLNDELNYNACGLYCKLEMVDVLVGTSQCYNCHMTATPLWRKDDEGNAICNVLVCNTICKPGRQSSSLSHVEPSPTLAPDSTTRLMYEYNKETTIQSMSPELIGPLGQDAQNNVYVGQSMYSNISILPYPDYLSQNFQTPSDTLAFLAIETLDTEDEGRWGLSLTVGTSNGSRGNALSQEEENDDDKNAHENEEENDVDAVEEEGRCNVSAMPTIVARSTTSSTPRLSTHLLLPIHSYSFPGFCEEVLLPLKMCHSRLVTSELEYSCCSHPDWALCSQGNGLKDDDSNVSEEFQMPLVQDSALSLQWMLTEWFHKMDDY